VAWLPLDLFLRPNHPNFAFYEMVWQKENYLAIWPFLNVEENCLYFKACFGEIGEKLAIFYEILTLNFVILTVF